MYDLRRGKIKDIIYGPVRTLRTHCTFTYALKFIKYIYKC